MESGVLAFCAFLRSELVPAASVQHSQYLLAFPLFQEGVERVEPRWSTIRPQNGGAQSLLKAERLGCGGNSGPPGKWEALQPRGLGLSHP